MELVLLAIAFAFVFIIIMLALIRMDLTEALRLKQENKKLELKLAEANQETFRLRGDVMKAGKEMNDLRAKLEIAQKNDKRDTKGRYTKAKK